MFFKIAAVTTTDSCICWLSPLQSTVYQQSDSRSECVLVTPVSYSILISFTDPSDIGYLMIFLAGIRRQQLRSETLLSSNWEAFRKNGKAIKRSITTDGKATNYSNKSSVLSAAMHRLVDNRRSTRLIHNQDSKD